MHRKERLNLHTATSNPCKSQLSARVKLEPFPCPTCRRKDFFPFYFPLSPLVSLVTRMRQQNFKGFYVLQKLRANRTALPFAVLCNSSSCPDPLPSPGRGDSQEKHLVAHSKSAMGLSWWEESKELPPTSTAFVGSARREYLE